jgi:hypothetical protein
VSPASRSDAEQSLYIKGSSTPFVVGDVHNDLYRLHTEPIIQPVPVMSSLSISPDLLTSSGSSVSGLPLSESSKDGASVMNVQGDFDKGVFAVLSLASMYEHPSNEEKERFFGTVSSGIETLKA